MIVFAEVLIFWFIVGLFIWGLILRWKEQHEDKQRKVYDEFRDSNR